jgi:hypothetical protein
MVSGFAEGFMWINRNPGPSNVYINHTVTSEKYKRVIFRVIEKQLHISTAWFFEQSNCLDLVHFTIGKVRVGLGLQTFRPKSSTPQSDTKLL